MITEENKKLAQWAMDYALKNGCQSAKVVLYANSNASFELRDAKMDRLLADGAFLEASGRKAGEYISGNAGAADKCFDAIFNGKTDAATVCS